MRIISSRRAGRQEQKEYGKTIMKEEYDFSKGERGKFYHHGFKLNIPQFIKMRMFPNLFKRLHLK
jgi:hypothetical protein